MTDDRIATGPGSASLDRFGLLLAVVATSIVVQMLVDVRNPGESAGKTVAAILVTAASGAAAVLAFRASGISPKWIRRADIVVAIGLTGLLLLLITGLISDTGPATSLRGTPSLGQVVLLGAAPIAVARRLLQHRTVGIHTLLGAVAAYLLIAHLFASAFSAADTISSQAFFGAPEPSTSFMYFSLTTITTLGYGDLAPVTEMGRLLATSEAVLGQVFLVTFVAMIVGVLVQTRSERLEQDDRR